MNNLDKARELITIARRHYASGNLNPAVDALITALWYSIPPATYVPPPFNPVDLLACGRCPHTASQHGMRWDPKDGVIILADTWNDEPALACRECDCPGFDQGIE